MDQNNLLAGKTAVVTGGTKGIGFAIVERYLENGANVALLGSREETVDKATAKLADHAEHILGLWPRLTDPEAIGEAFAEVEKRFGSLDILVNNAGISSETSIYDYTMDEFQKIMNLNVVAPYVCCQAAARIMKKQGGGVIINASSMVTEYGQPTGVGYPVSKYAVNGLTISLARELGPDNIRVNAVAPGVTMTDMLKQVPENIIKPVIDRIPLGRAGQPVDMANAYLFLASDLASYVSGSILYVDGATDV